MPIEWVLPAVAVVLLIWGTIVYRRLVALQKEAEEAWADLDARLKERHELVSRLLQKVGPVLGVESKAVQSVVNARKVAATAHSLAAVGKAEATLNTAVEALFARVRDQAELKADPGLRQLRSRFPEMQKEIEEAQLFFNEIVEDFNGARSGFPGGFVTFAVKLPPMEPMTVPKRQEPRPERAVQRL